MNAFDITVTSNEGVITLTGRVKEGGIPMLGWAMTFLIIAIIAALLGFGGVAGTATWIAQVLFVLFLVLFVVALLMGRRAPPV